MQLLFNNLHPAQEEQEEEEEQVLPQEEQEEEEEDLGDPLGRQAAHGHLTETIVNGIALTGKSIANAAKSSMTMCSMGLRTNMQTGVRFCATIC